MARVASWIDYQSQRIPHRTALWDYSTARRLSYREVDQRSKRLAGYLHSRGIRKGDRVAVLAQNSTYTFEVFYACRHLGAIMVPLNWRLSPFEISSICEDFAPSCFIADQHNLERATSIAAQHPAMVALSWSEQPTNELETALATGEPFSRVEELSEDDPWVIIYTSGTTGLPKGAVHTFRSVRANVENSAFVGELNANSVSLTVLPTFHVAGLHLFANAALMHGGQAIIMKSFDADEVLQLFQDRTIGVTHFCGVPANFQFMSVKEAYASAEFLPIKAVVGGSPVPQTIVSQWRERGIDIFPIYGATEAGSSLLAMPPRGSTQESAVGIPVIHAAMSIRDVTGQELGANQIGELWLRGPMLMRGYWANPAATAAAVTADGWLKTGDAARVDEDGVVSIVDRWKDMFISGGENVYPAEVEHVLYQHPEIVLASVIGVADEKWGEVGKAFIVLRKAGTVEAAGLKRWCLERLAKYKVPVEFEFVNDLPRNATGKILKNKLKMGELV